MSDYDERDKTEEEKRDDADSNSSLTNPETKEERKEEKKKESDYEDVCFMCRRPESKAGKMFKLPNNITVCNDCMHRTMDTVSQFDYQGMLNNPALMEDINKNLNGKGFPNIRFVNITEIGRASCRERV